MGGLAYPDPALGTRQDEAVMERVVGDAHSMPRAVGEASPDPILALIERHRQAYAEWLPHFDVITALVMGTPEFDCAEADGADPQRHEQEAYGSLLTVRPTTLAGLVAWASYLPGAVTANDVDDEDADGVRALTSMCDAVLSLVPMAPTRPTVDIAFSDVPPEQHAVLRAVQRHREAKQVLDTATRAADEVQIRNDGGDTSEAALRPLKAREAAASDAYDQAYRDLIATRPQDLPDLLTLLRHLAEHADGHRGMEDEPDVFGALIGAVEGMRLTESAPAAGHDLSRLSIGELEALARIARREHEALTDTGTMYASAWSSFTHLLNIVDAEGERFSLLSDHAVNEVARRRPADKHDGDLRLEAMVRHYLNCNGYIEPALMTELVAAWGAR